MCPLGFTVHIYLLFYFLITTVFITICTFITRIRSHSCQTAQHLLRRLDDKKESVIHKSVCTKPISIYLNLCRRVEDIFNTEKTHFQTIFLYIYNIGTRIS